MGFERHTFHVEGDEALRWSQGRIANAVEKWFWSRSTCGRGVAETFGVQIIGTDRPGLSSASHWQGQHWAIDDFGKRIAYHDKSKAPG